VETNKKNLQIKTDCVYTRRYPTLKRWTVLIQLCKIKQEIADISQASAIVSY